MLLIDILNLKKSMYKIIESLNMDLNMGLNILFTFDILNLLGSTLLCICLRYVKAHQLSQ